MATSTEHPSKVCRGRLSEMKENLIVVLVISPRIEQLNLEVHEILHTWGTRISSCWMATVIRRAGSTVRHCQTGVVRANWLEPPGEVP